MHHHLALSFALLLSACGARVSPDATPSDATTLDAIVDTGLEVSTDIFTCSAQNECVLAPNGCCGGPCGMPRLSDYTAVNRKHTADFAKITCTDPTPTCPGCVSYPNRYLFARCLTGKCMGEDLRDDALSHCTADSDCKLRYPGCCESCGGPSSELIAMRKDAEEEWGRTTCESPGLPCPPCVPSYPTGASAKCDPTLGHCYVVLPK